jgi:hypothetical protein
MANNVQAETVVSAGSRFVTAEVTAYGDASSHIPGCFMAIVSGSEGSQTFAEIVGGAGAVSAGVQRMTLASDDPAVVSVQIMDDWDESDRAKVNLIVGQAGIAAGAGTVAATVPRITLASDDPAVAALQIIDDAVKASASAVSKGMVIAGETVAGNAQTVTVRSAQSVAADDDGLVTRSILYGVDSSSAFVPIAIHGDGNALLVSVSTSVAVTNTSLETIDDIIVADDAAFTPGTTKVAMVGFEFDDAAPDSVNEGDAGAARMSANRCQYVMIRDNAGNERGLNIDASGQLAFSNTTIAVTNAGTFAVQAVCTNAGTFAVQAAQSGAWNITNVSGTVSLPTGASTLAEQQSQTTHLATIAGDTTDIETAVELLDDAVFTDDVTTFTAGTTKGFLTGGVVDDDSTDAADEGDAVIFRATKERKLRTVGAIDSAAMQSGNDQVIPKFAAISATSSGDNTIVAAVGSKKIRVLSLFFTANGTVTTRFESAASGTALTGQSDFIVNTGIVLPFNPTGWFETIAGELLNLELSGAVEVAGGLSYIEVD